MNTSNSTMKPTSEDIYYFETMAELDEYDQQGSDGRIVDAQVRAQLKLFVIGAVFLLAMVFVRHSFIYQLLVASVAVFLWVSYYLIRLLDLCDD